MAQSAKLHLRQSQGLALTPQLMQSIKLLQMNSVELNSFVQQEIEKNPLLELDSQPDEFPQERRNQLATSQRSFEQENSPPIGPKTQTSTVSTLQGSQTGESSNNISGGEVLSQIETRIASPQSLRQFLMQQAALSFKSELEMQIAWEIIDRIDDDGYFRFELKTIGSLSQYSPDLTGSVLAKIQTFDPPGVGARTLGECMRLQLVEKNRFDPAMEIFTNNLELLARRDYQKLAQLCHVEMDDLIEMAREIQELEPRPGDIFDSTPVANVIPDVLISARSDGSWHVELNQHTLPRVLINREYYAEIKGLGLKKADSKFMVDSLQSANWLVASLDQRAQTIVKVASEIVRQQDGFFLKGEEYLKPLTLKAVAERIKMHESTISRVTRNKYLSCERGVFELKYFFMSGVSSSNGEMSYGGQSIRAKIQNLILNEEADAVLSDEKLAVILGKEGIVIARRTVMKYRESLGIQSSVHRRREKQALKNG